MLVSYNTQWSQYRTTRIAEYCYTNTWENIHHNAEVSSIVQCSYGRYLLCVMCSQFVLDQRLAPTTLSYDGGGAALMSRGDTEINVIHLINILSS